MFTKKMVLGAALLTTSVVGFSQFTLSGQYRPRVEVRNGFKTPMNTSQQTAVFSEHRARLTAGYKKDKMGFKMSLQDVRIWGEVGQINKSDHLLSAHEAYGEFYASPKSTFRIGRQEVIYDGHRLFGSLGWAAQARAFDAFRYLYKDTMGNQFDAMLSWNQTGYGDGAPEPAKLVGSNYSTTNGGNDYRIFNLPLPKSQAMLYYKKKFSSGSLGVMLLNDMFNSNDSTTEIHSQFTVGLTPDFKFSDIKVGGQFFFTGGAAGKTYDAVDDEYENIDLSGFMFNAYVQHTGIKGKPLLGVDYLSGDDESTSEVEGWSPSYGTNHKFYGFMDYFYVGNGHGGGNAKSAGLMDLYLKTAFKVGEKSKLLAHLHYFASTAERTGDYDGDGNTEAYSGGLGTELDLVYVRKLAPGIVVKAGYSHMFGLSETMGVLKGYTEATSLKGAQNWGWVMINFAPKFLN